MYQTPLKGPEKMLLVFCIDPFQILFCQSDVIWHAQLNIFGENHIGLDIDDY